MFAAAKPFALTLGITGPLVCYQGAAIFEASTGAVLRETPVRQDVTRQVLAWAEDHHVHAQCYADDKTLPAADQSLFPSATRIWQRSNRSSCRRCAKRFAERPTIKIVLGR